MLRLFLRRLEATCINWRYPQIAHCGRCNRNWQICREHTTQYNQTFGMFVLCQDCWKELSVAERLPYYKAVFDSNGAVMQRLRQEGKLPDWHGENEWPAIEAAVLAGK